MQEQKTRYTALLLETSRKLGDLCKCLSQWDFLQVLEAIASNCHSHSRHQTSHLYDLMYFFAAMKPLDWHKVRNYYRNSDLTLQEVVERMVPQDLVRQDQRYHVHPRHCSVRPIDQL